MPNVALPVCSNMKAFNTFAREISRINSVGGLQNMACAIAMNHRPKYELAPVETTLTELANRIRSRVRGEQPQALLAHLHEVLFEDEGFTGNALNYHSEENSYLPAVLDTKLGLPITLSLIYRLVAERVGFRSWGVAVPGHFIAGIEVDGQSLLIDAFQSGRILTGDEVREKAQEVVGSELEWSDDYLAPASNRHWLTRILQNILNVFGAAGRYREVAAMLEMEILLWPDQLRLHRDLGLVLARIGMSEHASAWLGKYLASNPDDPQFEDLSHLRDVLAT